MAEIAAFLRAECGVRYWEDARIDGVIDVDGALTPCRVGDAWAPVIELVTGRIEGWPQGTVADLHFKVCDDGRYALLDADRQTIRSIDGYVPKIMCPGGNGYGDYVIMKIGPDGVIENWRADLSGFEVAP